MTKTYIDRESGPAEVTYKIQRPEGGWKRMFNEQERKKLRPMAETLAMLDGNAFFSRSCGEDDIHYENYLPEAHAVYESNGGDTGWASEASFARDLRMIQEDHTLKDAYDKLQVLLALKRKENGNT